jgi:predicted glycosyltransferase
MTYQPYLPGHPAGDAQPLRVAMYSQDGFGLGHMRRTSSIAWKIFQMRPDAGILTLSDSRLGQFFSTSPNHDYLKLPSIYKAGPDDWRAANLPLGIEAVLELRKQIIRSTLLNFAPHIFLVDHMPQGALGELLPTLDAIRQTGQPTRVILGLRDILDAPEVIQRRWEVEKAYEAIECYYDRILVYGMREVYDVVEKYKFSDAAANLVRYCGYVCNQDSPADAGAVRAEYLAGLPSGTRLIVAMAGGGADAYPLMSALLDALPLIQKKQRCVLALVTGPFLPPEQAAELNLRAQKAPVRVMESVGDTLSLIGAADLVVAMAGYNTSVEILRMKKPAILVPRRGPSAEQRTRARLFSTRRWVDMIDPDDLSAQALADGILSGLSRPVCFHWQTRPDLHGGSVAANQVLALQDEPPLDPEYISVPVPHPQVKGMIYP